MTVQIREIHFPEDFPQVENLWISMEKGVSLGPSDAPNEIQKKLTHDPDLFLVAEEDGQIMDLMMLSQQVKVLPNMLKTIFHVFKHM